MKLQLLHNTRLDLVHVCANGGRLVPMLLSKKIEEEIEILINKRQTFRLFSESKFVFTALARKTKKPMTGSKCLPSVISWVPDLQRPELIKSAPLK